MRSILTDLAKRQIRQTARYISREFGQKRRDAFIQEVRRTRFLIESHPNLGPVEPLLAHRTRLYRSIVVSPLNKLIYYVDDATIEIIAVWDTRRDPSSLVAEVK